MKTEGVLLYLGKHRWRCFFKQASLSKSPWFMFRRRRCCHLETRTTGKRHQGRSREKGRTFLKGAMEIVAQISAIQHVFEDLLHAQNTQMPSKIEEYGTIWYQHWYSLVQPQIVDCSCSSCFLDDFLTYGKCHFGTIHNRKRKSDRIFDPPFLRPSSFA